MKDWALVMVRWTWKALVRRSGKATAGSFSNVNTGFQILTSPATRPARSAYFRQVEQIFPGILKDRERELAELQEFCTRPDGSSYIWWQAPAWSGKSALMATLVVNPPPGVRIVSFFITARWAGQGDRTAFLEAALEQLAEISGQSMPDLLTESNRQQWFLQLLKEAASVCTADGLRLVLVVDGLDEDRGVTRGPNAHSIAALLPGNPPPGVRIVVAGRPNPPVPADVPEWHPLRDPQIVRVLKASQWAVAIRDDAERELATLLIDDGLGRELLSLLVVSGGGLSVRDMAELTGEPVGEVERSMRAVTGRSFAMREPQWSALSGQLFVLAHEELVQSALHSLLPAEIAGYRNKIHEWADVWRSRGWPVDTPEYLLRGYLSMLYAAGDLERMRALTTDHIRLDRMLHLSGGDAAAMADIVRVQEYIRDQPYPDLTTSLHEALTREYLIRRNSNIPINLPASWALLGNSNRAQALADSITDQCERVQALSTLVVALVQVGQFDRARQLAIEAETAIHCITNPFNKPKALRALVMALVQAGEVDRARQAINDINATDHANYIFRYIHDRNILIEALVQTGQLSQAKQLLSEAEKVTFSITDLHTQVNALSTLVNPLLQIGESDRARHIATTIDAKILAAPSMQPFEQAHSLISLVRALIKIGELDQSRKVTNDVERVARSIVDPTDQAGVLCDLVEALVEGEEFERIEVIARSIDEPEQQARAISISIKALVRVGRLDLAEVTARSISNSKWQAQALSTLAEALIRAGEVDRARQAAIDAENIGRSLSDTYGKAHALCTLVNALVQASEPDQARQVAKKAEAIANALTDAEEQALALGALVKALINIGDLDQAETVSHRIAYGNEQVEALNVLVKAFVRNSSLDRARQVVGDIESFARSLTDLYYQAQAMNSLLEGLAQIGEFSRLRQVAADAEAIANSIADQEERNWALRSLVRTLTEAREFDWAESIAYSVTDPSEHSEALSILARGLARTGKPEKAEIIARSIIDLESQIFAFSAIVAALFKSGESNQAQQLAAHTEAVAASINNPFSRARALSFTVNALVQIGDLDRAEAVARSIDNLSDQERMLGYLAKELARIGKQDQAESVFRSISSQYGRGQTLKEMKDFFGPKKSRKLLASILVGARPMGLLGVVATIDPQAVVHSVEYVHHL